MRRIGMIVCAFLAGLVSSSSVLAQAAPATISVQTAPTVSVTSPPANAVISVALTPAVLLKATVATADAPISHVVLYVCQLTNGNCSPSDTRQFDTIAPYEVLWTPPAPVAQGGVTIAYTLQAMAVNSLGEARSSSTIPFSLIFPPPSPSVTLEVPKIEGGYVTPASPVLFATASPGSTIPPSTVARVDFLDGGTVIGTVTVPNSVPTGYAYVWQNAPGGIHLVAARVTDSLGYSKTTDAVTIYIIGPDPPPLVTLTAPATGQIFAPPNAVPLAAVASSALGTIQRVEFMTADRIIATAFSPPYAASWSNPPPGNFAIVATAFDDIGVAAASPAAYIQVLPTPRVPAVVMTAPAPGTTVTSGTPVPMAATALAPDGSIGRVDFFAGTTMLGSSASAPYQFTWANPSAGTQSLVAKGYDLQGNVGVSAAVGITVMSHPSPTVNLTMPANGSTYTVPANVALFANANATGATIAKVDFLADGAVVATSSAAPFNATWNNVGTGNYVLTAKATDSLGATAISSAVNVVVSANQPPQVTLTAPTNAQNFYAGQPVTFAANASDADGAVAKVEFMVDGAVVGSVASAPYNFTWNGATAGSHTVFARASDNLGAQATSASVSITITANAPPTVALTLPRNGQSFAAGAPIPLAATAAYTGGSIARVEFLADGIVVASASTAPYNATWTSASTGAHTLVARVVDDHDGSTSSAPVTIQVVTLALTITTPTPDATIPADFVLVSGTYQAPPNSGVTINGVVARNDGQGRYFVNNLPLGDGSNTITVTLTTQDGQTVTQTRTITRNGMAPFQVSAEPDGDIAPAGFTIRVTNRTENAIVNTVFSNLGGGQVDGSSADQTTLGKISYTAPGFYSPTFVVTDSAGNSYTQTVALLAQDGTALEQTLKAIWSDFSTALALGDISSAMKFLSGGAQFRYRSVFATIAPSLPAAAANMESPQTGSLATEVAEFSVGRTLAGIKRLYFIYFLRSPGGIWQLDTM